MSSRLRSIISLTVALALRPLEGTGLRQLSLPSLKPTLIGLLTIEGLAFLMDLRAITHDPDLCRIAGGAAM